MKIWLLSAALVLSGCGLFGTLVPDQEIAGDALGFDNQISETSTTLNDLTATIRLQAVGAAGTVSGTFNRPLAKIPTMCVTIGRCQKKRVALNE
jgi:hypothetical protein